MGVQLEERNANGSVQAADVGTARTTKRPRRPKPLSPSRRAINTFFETYEVPETLTMAALSLVYVVLTFLDGEATQFLGENRIHLVVYLITAVFIAEFATRLFAAESRFAYARKHAFDLLAVLPTLQFLRLLGLARLVVLLRLLRLVRVGVIAHGLINANRGLAKWKRLSHRNGLTSLFMLSFGFLWIGADLAYQFEHGVNPQFASFADAVWWAFSTMATLGYGTGPVTFMGRMVAGVLMVLGIACFGLVTATATTFFVERTEKAKEYSNADLMDAIRGIERRLSALERS